MAVELWQGDDDVPTHPALSVLADSEQYLTSRYRCDLARVAHEPDGWSRTLRSSLMRLDPINHLNPSERTCSAATDSQCRAAAGG